MLILNDPSIPVCPDRETSAHSRRMTASWTPGGIWPVRMRAAAGKVVERDRDLVGVDDLGGLAHPFQGQGQGQARAQGIAVRPEVGGDREAAAAADLRGDEISRTCGHRFASISGAVDPARPRRARIEAEK